MKRILYRFTIIFILGILISGTLMVPGKVKEILDIVQAVVLISVAVFTAWWTSKTFGHELRSKEAKSIINELQGLQNIISNVKHPIPDIKNDKGIISYLDISKLEELTKIAEEKAFLDYLTSREILMHKCYTSISIKPFTQTKIISLLNKYSTKEKITNDKNNAFMMEIIFLQRDVAEEAYFDIGSEIKSIRNQIGI